MIPVENEPLSRHALAFVLAGGRGNRLLELTDRRAKPAVYSMENRASSILLSPMRLTPESAASRWRPNIKPTA